MNLRKRKQPFAFVEFVDPEAVNKAVEMFNNQVLDGETIVVEVAKSPRPPRKPRARRAPRAAAETPAEGAAEGAAAPAADAAETPAADAEKPRRQRRPRQPRRPRPETPISKNVAHVGNLPYVVDDEGMKDIFEGCKFTEVHVVRYNRSQRSKGYGFVTFANEEDRAEAIKMVDGSVVEGRKITVAPAHERVEVAEAATDAPAAAAEETPVENQ